MWLLKDSNGKIRYLKPGKTIKVGRKQSDIVLESDTSISRAHSTIEISIKLEATTAERASTCIVKDANSKYGTSIIRNGTKIKVSNEGVELQPSDTLHFGLQQHVFKVEHIHFVSVISCLNAEHKRKLKSIMDEIGGLVTDIFDDNCTHLTATTATSTTKIISAIIAGIPVVKINFWLEVLEAIKQNEKLPDPNDFILPLYDKGLNSQRVSLKPNPARKSLFQGKTFIFFSEKLCEEYNKMIKDAGGKPELYCGSYKNIPENFFANNSLVMQVTVESLTDDLAAFNTLVYDKMQEKKLRMIAETEIPLAILYASLDQYCNPKYHFKELIKRKDLKKDETKILALDTQDIETTTSKNKHSIEIKQVCLPETNDFIEENITKSESIDLNIVSQQADSEINSIKEDAVHRKKSDKKFANKMMDIDTNPVEKNGTSESLKKIESQSDNLANNINFRLKRSSITALESTESKKRMKEKIGDDEKTKNVQIGWKSKKCTSSLDITKKQSTLTESKDDFNELEQKKSQIKEKKQDKLSKWGFKKTEKKAIDFDLDDFEEDEPKVEVKQKTIKSLRDTNRECKNSSEEKIESQKSSKTLESYQDNKTLRTKSLNDSTNLKENMHKNWTAFKNSKSQTNIKGNLSNDNGTHESRLIRPSIKEEEIGNQAMGIKTFKKVHSVIPIKRIALADMTVWTPNS